MSGPLTPEGLTHDEWDELVNAIGNSEVAQIVLPIVGRIKNEAVADLVAVDETTRHLWHTSQHNKIPIWLAGRIQQQVRTLRDALELDEFGWNTAFPDAEFGECSVHTDECQGQETHS